MWGLWKRLGYQESLLTESISYTRNVAKYVDTAPFFNNLFYSSLSVVFRRDVAFDVESV